MHADGKVYKEAGREVRIRSDHVSGKIKTCFHNSLEIKKTFDAAKKRHYSLKPAKINEILKVINVQRTVFSFPQEAKGKQRGSAYDLCRGSQQIAFTSTIMDVIFHKRGRVFNQGFQTREKTDVVFECLETLIKYKARV